MIDRHRRVAAAALAASSLLLTAPVAAMETPPPASAFARLPAMTMVRLSPDGNRVAWASFDGDKPVVTMSELSTGMALRRIDLEAAYALNEMHWAENDLLLIEISTNMELPYTPTGGGTYRVVRYLVIDVAGSPPRALLLNDNRQRRNLVSSRLEQLHTGRAGKAILSSFRLQDYDAYELDGRGVASGPSNDDWIQSLFEVDLYTGDARQIDTNAPSLTEWIFNRAGKPVARSQWNRDKRDFRIQIDERGRWKTIYSAASPNVLSPMGLSADEKAIIAVGARGGDRSLAWQIALDGGEISLLQDTAESVESTVPDRFTGAVAGLRLGGIEPRTLWLDPKLEGIQRAVGKAFPGQAVEIYDRTSDYSRVLVSVEGPSSPRGYYLIDLSRGQADTIGEAYPELVGAKLGNREDAGYRSRDGAQIPAYLTLPPGRAHEKLPLVVLPPGGPASRTDARFDWLVQYLATHGFAVLQPQLRGSSGFGAGHQQAGKGTWGQVATNDLIDGVAALAARGMVDPQRVCIVGNGYGGYAALAAVTFTPESYACAVSIDGVSDLPGMFVYLRRWHGEDSSALDYWRYYFGHPTDDQLAALSPARSATAIRAPVLLIHATDAVVMPLAQSELMADVLERLRKAHQLLRLEGVEHSFQNSRSRLRVLQAMDVFLAEHLAKRH